MRKLFVNAILFLLFVPILVGALNPSLNDDVLGLIVFKSDVQDPDGKLESWNEEDDTPCNWNGISCNPRSNRVSDVVLDGFRLSGRISRGLLRLQFIRKLSLVNNNFTGAISVSLAQLPNLKILDLSQNSLSGSIPDDYFQQCGPLRSLSLANNGFSGQIPDSLSSCVALGSLNLSSNQFSGFVPSGIWSLNGLRSLDLSDNLLVGEIPSGIQGLRNLRTINLGRNRFVGGVPEGIGSCLLLRSVDFGGNSLTGVLPSTMQKLSLCNNLVLKGNGFVGVVPEWVGEMRSLEILDFAESNFSGQIPTSIGKLQSLKVLNLSLNAFSGSLPESLRSCVNLKALEVRDNSLTGTIPGTVGQLKSLDILDLSGNRLNGNVPVEIGGITSLRELRLEKNALTGEIPTSIGNCSSLVSLSLSHNGLTGPIPASLAKLTYLQNVDLSFNKFTGMLPKQLGELGHLSSFNISHNQLQGELPTNGFFNTISPNSVSGNPSLCGAAVNRSCSTVMPKPIVLNPNSTDSTPTSVPQSIRHEKKILSISALIAIGAAAVIFVGVIAITVLNIRVRSTTSRSAAGITFSGGDEFSHSPSTDTNSGKLVMFSGNPDFSTGAHALLNKDCELGRGGFGAVYHTVLKDGHPVAIKKLTVSSLVKSQEDFEREVRKLGKARHHNLVTLEGYYWTPSLQLLIYEFVAGGSLYKHLHEGAGGGSLTWNDRFNIILGTAKSLSHLHQMNIIHYNLKSSNILIDNSGEPKVADYGLARLLPMLDRYVLSSKIQSALGYMAPEFSCKTVKITEKCDVYGFGVLVLEVVTGKRPVEYMDDDVVVLCDMVRGALEEGRVEDCVDARLQGKFPADEAIPVMKLGLVCTSQVPSNRPDMAEVVNILELIRCPSEGPDELL